MKISKSEKVNDFLNKLQLIDVERFDILAEIRKLVFDIYPRVEEKIMYGGIIFTLDSEMFGGVFAFKNHVTIEFSQGFQMKDPKGQLEGKGKFRRHLKLRTKDDMTQKDVTFFVKQSI